MKCTLHEDRQIFLIISRSVLLSLKNITNVVNKLEIHILCAIPFFFENCAVYEIMWKNIVERGRPQMTIGTCELHAGNLRLQIHTQIV
jgi:NADPH-dependent 7-cyano-7-deazaguanine reductase QueF-like protein